MLLKEKVPKIGSVKMTNLTQNPLETNKKAKWKIQSAQQHFEKQINFELR